MKKVLVLLLLGFCTSGLFGRYELVETPVEFRELLDEHDYTLACFVDTQSDQGRFLSDIMELLALSGDFGKRLQDRFAFVVLPAQRARLSKLVEKYEYEGDPLFVLFEFDRLVAKSDLQGNYGVDAIKQFLNDSIEDSLVELLLDVERIKEAARNQEQHAPSCRVTLDQITGLYPRRGFLFRGKPYWWYRRYYRAPYKYGPKPRAVSGFNR